MSKENISADHYYGSRYADLLEKHPATDYRSLDAAAAEASRVFNDRPRRDRVLENLLRPGFTESSGMMNDVFARALAFDLRGLAPDLAAFATASEKVPDGDGATYSGGNFKGPVGQHYHLAREITALWQEPDAATRAKMWIALISNRPRLFEKEGSSAEGTGHELRQRAEAAIRELPKAERKDQIKASLKMAIERVLYPPDEEITAWLTALGDLS